MAVSPVCPETLEVREFIFDASSNPSSDQRPAAENDKNPVIFFTAAIQIQIQIHTLNKLKDKIAIPLLNSFYSIA